MFMNSFMKHIPHLLLLLVYIQFTFVKTDALGLSVLHAGFVCEHLLYKLLTEQPSKRGQALLGPH